VLLLIPSFLASCAVKDLIRSRKFELSILSRFGDGSMKSSLDDLKGSCKSYARDCLVW